MTTPFVQTTVDISSRAVEHRLPAWAAESFRDFAGLLAVSGAVMIAAWSWKVALLLAVCGIVAWPILSVWRRTGGLGGFSLHLAASTALLAILASSLWMNQVEGIHPAGTVSAAACHVPLTA